MLEKNRTIFQTQQCVCGTDLCNKDFDTAAAKGHFDDDGDDLYNDDNDDNDGNDFYGAPSGNYDANVIRASVM